ncbi:hypothetical protein THO17_08480 [Marinomonas sp. THO17]
MAVLFLLMVTFSAESWAQSDYQVMGMTAADCPVDATWLTQPSLPVEVKKSGADGSSNFCDFYQFANQTYLYLMSPSTSEPKLRNFQVNEQFSLLEFNDDGTPADSCDMAISGSTLRTGLQKSSLITGQAGGGATIYDQEGNVIYYDVRFTRNLCDLSASAVELQQQNITNFPAGTIELKFAWKTLSVEEVEKGQFVTQQQLISKDNVTLGLIGVHIVVATEDHPEFIWATYEHKFNSPDCLPSSLQEETTWTMASQSCTAGLADSADAGNACNFNNPPEKLTAPIGTPTNICRVHPYGTVFTDANAWENISVITQQNQGIDELLKKQGDADMQVLENYFNVGALWASDITMSSGGKGVPNERGSLRLANSVAETRYQQVDINSDFASNCFGCHNYTGTSKTVHNNITSQALSHIFKDIKIGQGLDIDVYAQKVFMDNNDAQNNCPSTCSGTASYLKWNGNWTNINPSSGSVCGCGL